MPGKSLYTNAGREKVFPYYYQFKPNSVIKINTEIH